VPGHTRSEIILKSDEVKTRRGRSIDLVVSPSVVPLLSALRLRSGGAPYVFGGEAPLLKNVVDNARRRLATDYGGPVFTWQQLRQTAATVLTNAPGIYGAASAWHPAKRCGHSIAIAEKRYAGLLRDEPKDAGTLEAALGVEDLVAGIVACLVGTGAGTVEEGEVREGAG